jgi:hypothetical protein
MAPGERDCPRARELCRRGLCLCQNRRSGIEDKQERLSGVNGMEIIVKRLLLLALAFGLTAGLAACGKESGTATAPRETGARPAPDNAGAANQETKTAPSAPPADSTAGETGSTRSAVTLMSAPYSDAKPAGQLPPNAAVDILERRGGWMRISGQGKTGWAKLFQVRTGAGTAAQKSAAGVAILRNIGETGRSGSQGIVATTGIRGLSAEDLTTAKPDPQAVAAMDAYRASDATARQYAQSAGLKEKNIPFLSQ